MFKSQPPGGPVPPGEDGPVGPAMQVPQIPPKRTFVLHRWDPTEERGPLKPPTVVETFVIEAHEVEINASGNILRFREYLIHPVEGPTNRVVRCFNGWLDYEERIIERSLITPVSIM